MSEVRVERTRSHPTSSVVAEFDAALGRVTIRSCCLVHGRHGHRFLGLSSRRPPDSEQGVDPVVLSDALRGRVLATAEEALRVVQLQPVDAIPEVPF